MYSSSYIFVAGYTYLSECSPKHEIKKKVQCIYFHKLGVCRCRELWSSVGRIFANAYIPQVIPIRFNVLAFVCVV